MSHGLIFKYFHFLLNLQDFLNSHFKKLSVSLSELASFGILNGVTSSTFKYLSNRDSYRKSVKSVIN